ncbi:MAG: TetR/AcrR family transcriptional regulator [Ekhidna sp.]|nr:TetR/AcrR family transcriptional regulator [Ekhidna sp.]
MAQSETFLDKKAHIIQSAFALFSKNGIKATTVDQVAKYAGVSKKTIYLNFRTKDALIRDAFAWKMGGLAKAVDEVVSSESSSLEKLANYLEIISAQISEISLKSLTELDGDSVFSKSASGEYLKRAVFIRFNKLLEQAKAEKHIHEKVEVGNTLMSYWNMLSPFLLLEGANVSSNEGSEVSLNQLLNRKILQLYREILKVDSMSELEEMLSEDIVLN